MIKQIHQLLATDIEKLDSVIIDQLVSKVDLVENIGHYIVDAGGKRLRPLLALLASNAIEPNDETEQDIINFSAIVEFIHTATLLHDDVVDISSLRRGRPTANAEFGNAPSVLVGDFIYSRAFQMLVGIGNMNIMALMSDTTNQIAEGEVLQLTKAGDATTSESEYLRVITDKTAILFAAALEGTAILHKADTQTQQSLKEYGLALGIAFQVADDILDYQGDAEVMGKNVGDDLSEGKPTLPLIYAMEQANVVDAQIIKDAITNKSAEKMPEIFRIIQETKALDYCKSFAAQYVNQAKTALSPLKDSEYKNCLDSLCDFAVERVQ